MRDFRDAKAMAKSLREGLAAKSIEISHSESLELIAQVFGLRDWNTLAARISAEHAHDRSSAAGPSIDPAIIGASSPEALLLALMRNEDAAGVLRECGADLAGLEARLEEHFAQAPDVPDSAQAAEAVKRVVERATFHSLASETEELTAVHVLIALFSVEDSPAVRLLHEQGLTRLKVVSFLVRHGQGPTDD